MLNIPIASVSIALVLALLTHWVAAGVPLRIDYHVWNRHQANWPPADLRPIQSLDVLIYFRTNDPDDSGRLVLPDDAVAHLAELKKVVNPKTKILLGVYDIGNLIGSSARTAGFVGSVRELSATHGFAGLDIDWEDAAVSTADYAAVLGAISAELRGPDFLVTNSVGTAPHYIAKSQAVKDLIDWTHIQFYHSTINSWSVERLSASLGQFAAAGVPARQIAIGLPVYGSQDMRTYVGGPSSLGYRQMIEAGASPEANLWTHPATGYTYHYSGVPLIRDKVAHAVEGGYRGVFGWEPTLDANYGFDASILRAIDQTLAGDGGQVASVPLIDPSFESAAPGSTLGVTNSGVGGGWWMNPEIHPGGSAGVIFVNDSGAADGTQTLLLGYANQLRAIEQTVNCTFDATSDYTLTVFGRAISAGNDALLRLEFFRADNGARVGEAVDHVIVSGADRDVAVTVTAGQVLKAGAVDHHIGIRLIKSDLLGEDTELRVDHVRLRKTTTNDAAELELQSSYNLSDWQPIESRFLTAAEAALGYRLRIAPIDAVDLQDPGFESQAANTQFPTTFPGIGGGWWRDTTISPGGNGGMLYVSDASSGDGGSQVAMLGYPAELRSLQQTVAAIFVAGIDYTLTAYARALASGSFAENEQVDLTMTLFLGNTGTVIKEQTFTIVKGTTGAAGDRSFTVTAAEIAAAGAIGALIGIRLNKSALYPAVGSSPDGRIELRIDQVRLTHTPVPGGLALLTETSADHLRWSPAALRQVPVNPGSEFFQLRINPLPDASPTPFTNLSSMP